MKSSLKFKSGQLCPHFTEKLILIVLIFAISGSAHSMWIFLKTQLFLCFCPPDITFALTFFHKFSAQTLQFQQEVIIPTSCLHLRHHGSSVGEAPPQHRQSGHQRHQRRLCEDDQRELRAQWHPGGRKLTGPPGARGSQRWCQRSAHCHGGGHQDGRQCHHAPARVWLHVSELIL